MMRRINLEHKGVVIRKQPPIVGDYCRVPSSGKVDEACSYRSATCRGDSATCARCGFAYCDKHYSTHVRQFVVPPDAWRTFLRRLWAALEAAAHNPGRRVRLGNVAIEEEA